MRFKLWSYGIFNLVRVLCIVILAGAISVLAQTTEVAKTQPVKSDAQETKAAALMPVLTEYKGIKIGMTADEVRETLNEKPEVADKDGFYYEFSSNESAQIMLDADKKVRVIAVIYRDNSVAPKYEDVFGKDVPLETMPDGRVYNLVRYPDNGFWVAYNRTAGDSPLVTVTIQKMQQ